MGTGSGGMDAGGSRPSAASLALGLAAFLVALPAPVVAGDGVKRVLVLYPVSDGQPGILRFDENLRSRLNSAHNAKVEIYNEYLDAARFPDERHQRHLAEFLRAKYSDRTPDVIVPALAPSLDFLLKYRDVLFPGVPVVYGAIDRREAEARRLGPDVIGIPMTVDLVPTLDLALRLHPGTRRVFVVAGASKTDAYWIAEARRAFRGHEGKVSIVYLTGLPREDLLRRVAGLPDRSLIYYLHIFKDGRGETFVPSEVVGLIASAANAPVYGNYNTYVGRGIVGGRVVSFDAEGVNAARLASRILAGERPADIAPPGAGENPAMFDWRQLSRWGIDEGRLPLGSIVLNRPPSLWGLYRWRIIGAAVFLVAQALLIVVLLLERANRRRTEGAFLLSMILDLTERKRAEKELRASQLELRALTGRLLRAQETERRRIARELHDDLNQSLALVAIELDLIARDPPAPGAPADGRVLAVSDRVKQLSTAVHDLSHNLHPAKLERLGLVAAIRGLCGELIGAHAVQIEFVGDGIRPGIPDDTALCLYRIAQEALRNVVKHSGARHARVELRGTSDAISLTISDDGSGFDPDSPAGKDGLGLLSMRERLRLVGGELTVDSRPSGGTRIVVRSPLAMPDAGGEVASHEHPARL